MTDPSAKRVAAKITSAPTRNALNATGSSGQAASMPIHKRVSEALKGAMNSGDGSSPAKVGGVTRPYKKVASFGDNEQIKQGNTRKVTGPATPSLPSSKGSVSKLGRGVD